MLARDIFETQDAHLVNAGPSVSELAALCSHIYNTVSPPDGWQLLHSIDTGDISGYRAAVYVKNLLTPDAQAVFVHRGTVFSFPENIGNIIADLQVYFGSAIVQGDLIRNFVDAAKVKMEAIYKGHDDLLKFLRVVSTGHSLGAVFSDCATLGKFPSITFESPGSRATIEEYLIKNWHVSAAAAANILNNVMPKLCSTYQADINIINCCNTHVGSVYHLSDLRFDYTGVGAPDYYHFYTNPYFLAYTKQQHNVDNIAAYLKNDGASTLLDKCPANPTDSYIAYLDGSRKKYWDGYFQEIWKTNPEARAKFPENYEGFLQYCYGQLKLTQQKAIEVSLLDSSTTAVEQRKEINQSQILTEVGVFKLLPKNENSVVVPAPGRSCAIL